MENLEFVIQMNSLRLWMSLLTKNSKNNFVKKILFIDTLVLILFIYIKIINK